MTARRRFITLVPFAGVALLAACSKEVPAPAPAPMPMAEPTPAPVQMAPPAAADASTPTTAGAPTAELPLLQTSDPTAVALGYIEVANQVDGSKFQTYAAGQACNNCQLFGGYAGDEKGPCPLFAGKAVLAAGWCSGYVKKA